MSAEKESRQFQEIERSRLISNNELITISASKMAKIPLISPGDATVTPFVVARRNKNGKPMFLVGEYMISEKTDAILGSCCVRLEMDPEGKGLDYTSAWRILQVISHCETYAEYTLEAATDFVLGKDWGDRSRHKFIGNPDMDAVRLGHEPSPIEKLYSALGGIENAEHLFREVLSVEPDEKEIERVNQRLVEKGIIS